MKKNKLLLIIIGVIIICMALVYIKLFIIGNNNYEDIQINKVSLSNNSIIIEGIYSNINMAYKSHNYILVGDELYIEVRNVLVNKNNNSGIIKIEIPVNGNNIKNIHLTDNKTTKVIYSK